MANYSARCGWGHAARGRRSTGWEVGIWTRSTFPRKRASRDDRIELYRALTRRDDRLLLVDDVPPARSDRSMMAVIVRTEIRKQERGGLLPNKSLQPDEHLGRFAPAVVRR